MAEANVLSTAPSKRILVVDDNVWIAKVWAKRLSAGGYTVTVVAGGQEALDSIETDPPELILLDIVMPGMGGYEVCKSVKSDPATAGIGIFFLTGIGRPQERFRAEEAGADGYLVKSDISPQILLEEVDRFFAARPADTTARPEDLTSETEAKETVGTESTAHTGPLPAQEVSPPEEPGETETSDAEAQAPGSEGAGPYDGQVVPEASPLEGVGETETSVTEAPAPGSEGAGPDDGQVVPEASPLEGVGETETSIAEAPALGSEGAGPEDGQVVPEASSLEGAGQTETSDAEEPLSIGENVSRGVQRQKLGDRLIDAGIINEEQLAEALRIQKTTSKPLGEILIEMGTVDSGQVEQLLEFAYEAPFVKLGEYILDPEAVSLLPKEIAQRFKVIPVKKDGSELTVAMTNPRDLLAIDQISFVCKMEIQPVLASPKDIDEAIGKYYGMGVTLESAMEKVTEQDLTVVDDEETILDESRLRELGEEAPVMQLVNMVIFKAVQDRASDIHIQAHKDRVLVRYRVDGVLQDILTLPVQVHAATLSRIKVMASLDIAERRVPQDGRIDLKVGGDEIDLRVSTLPTLFGEKAVMRILNKSQGLVPLEQMGMTKGQLDAFEGLIKRPHGLILVTGPTGSGKTTTLYAALKVINVPQKNIITVEDPVEYQLSRINQVPVNVKAQLTFASALRSILRQDPDVVMVGEIRDLETARIAVQAALTGHLVLSSLHTNDASGAVSRLVDMGVEPFLVASSLTGVMAQRLARVVCSSCRQEYDAPEIEVSEHDLKPGTKLYKGKGCPKCRSTGYKGRTGIFEFLEVSSEIQTLIMQRADADRIKKTALEEGMRTLQDNAVEKMLAGNTTSEEVLRVTAE